MSTLVEALPTPDEVTARRLLALLVSAPEVVADDAA